jgi:hypothetical protein
VQNVAARDPSFRSLSLLPVEDAPGPGAGNAQTLRLDAETNLSVGQEKARLYRRAHEGTANELLDELGVMSRELQRSLRLKALQRREYRFLTISIKLSWKRHVVTLAKCWTIAMETSRTLPTSPAYGSDSSIPLSLSVSPASRSSSSTPRNSLATTMKLIETSLMIASSSSGYVRSNSNVWAPAWK